MGPWVVMTTVSVDILPGQVCGERVVSIASSSRFQPLIMSGLHQQHRERAQLPHHAAPQLAAGGLQPTPAPQLRRWASDVICCHLSWRHHACADDVAVVRCLCDEWIRHERDVDINNPEFWQIINHLSFADYGVFLWVVRECICFFTVFQTRHRFL